MQNKIEFHKTIRSNISHYGYHLTIVTSGPCPRYAYTIGLTETLGFELIFAGGVYYMKEYLGNIFKSIIAFLENKKLIDIKNLNISIGKFSLNNVSPSWAKLTMLGVYDYYGLTNIKAYQVIPDISHFTLDIPDMTKGWNEVSEPAWQWLDRKWNLPVPEDSHAITSLDVMQGKPITEVVRWEVDEWEMFAGSGGDVASEEIRIVPLGTLLGIDKTLYCSLDLEIGKGIWRDSLELKWMKWN